MFGEVFSVLSEEQRNAVMGWIKEGVALNEFKCLLKAPDFSIRSFGSLGKSIIRKF